MIDAKRFLREHGANASPMEPTLADLKRIYNKAHRLAQRCGFDSDTPNEILAALDTLLIQIANRDSVSDPAPAPDSL